MTSSIEAPRFLSVFRLRVVLRGVSPLIWRRLLVRSDTTLAELHTILQVAFGWDDVHLHRFKVHGREYDYLDGNRVRIGDLGLRATERFVYDYDFGDLWRHDLRVEQIRVAEPGGVYPVCTAGRRAGPPEDCGGPWAFVEQTLPFRLFAVTVRAAEIIGEVLDDVTLLEDYRDELAALYPWLGTERFERPQLNAALAGLCVREGCDP